MPSALSGIAVSLDIGPVFGEDSVAEVVIFHLRYCYKADVAESQRKTADAGEKVNVSISHGYFPIAPTIGTVTTG